MDDKEDEEGPKALGQERKGNDDVGAEEGAREPWFLPEPGGKLPSEGASDDTHEGTDPQHHPDLTNSPSLCLHKPDAQETSGKTSAETPHRA